MSTRLWTFRVRSLRTGEYVAVMDNLSGDTLEDAKRDVRAQGMGWMLESREWKLEPKATGGREGRCEVSGNPVGTDTWGNGAECPCDPCQRWLAGAAERATESEGR